MPSSFYSVTIAQTVGGTNGDGFIDNTPIEQYMAASSPTVPQDVAHSQSKKRANVRYEMMVADLLMMANCYPSNFSAPGADANTPPTSFSFLLEVDRGDEVLNTWDEYNPGTIITGAAAIVRCISRMFLTSRTDLFNYYDPTTSTSVGNGTNTPPTVRVGPRSDVFTVGALSNSVTTAATAITVTRLNI